MNYFQLLSDVTKTLRSIPQQRESQAAMRKINKETGKQTLVLYPPSPGCQWATHHGGCTMCGFALLNPDMYSEELALSYMQESTKLLTHEPETHIKVFASGSFFNEYEIPTLVRKELLQLVSSSGATRLIVETRPEDVCKSIIEETIDLLGDTQLELRIGVETTDDFVRDYCFHKGFSFSDFTSLSIALPECINLTTYLVLKPPFLSEKEAIDDVFSSICDLRAYATSIIVQPMSIQSGTLVEYLWKNGKYNPPSLWSLVEIGKRAFEAGLPVLFSGFTPTPIPLASATSCPKCSATIIQSLKKSPETLFDIHCSCEEKWRESIRSSNDDFENRVKEELESLALTFFGRDLDIELREREHGNSIVGFLKPDLSPECLQDEIVRAIEKVGSVELYEDIVMTRKLLDRIYPFSYGDKYIAERDAFYLGKRIKPFRLYGENPLRALYSLKLSLREKYNTGSSSFNNLLHTPDSRGESTHLEYLLFKD